ncbi:ABC transporter permease [Dethiobacter alkaliphilus]|uniref:ABC transporter permease n=1 Tax=Dethiobacter alkaliphilus TaxID=427926 RepID=UPI00222753AA|nr:hypothetical protein [Dethiobacter alkaliphilus]MCW3488564.1 hypothetical protein [Dethiobacter alkaliphilus]
MNNFIGTQTLVQLALRRDRVRLPAWLLGIAVMVGLITLGNAEFSAQEMKEMIIMASSSPGMRLFIAPIMEGNIGELGPFFLLRTSFIIAILVAMMNIQAVVRHTRENEETGCAEMLGSMVLGRYASLASALIVAVGANILMALLIALALMANDQPAVGSFAAGASFAAFGLVFAGVAAVTTQLSESARGSSGLASVTLAFAFLLNALGNVLGEVREGGLGFESTWIVWLSPLGWVQQVFAYGENNWWILTLFALMFTVLAYGSSILVNRRDVGRGILPARPGPATASPWLLSPLGLAWRLQRGTLLGWVIAITVFGAIFGAASQEYASTIEGIELFQNIALSAEYFLFSLISIIAAIIAFYTMQAIMRLRAEEAGGPLESVLATAVSRFQVFSSHIAVSVFGTVALLSLFALSSALAAGLSAGETLDLLKAALFQGAAVMTLAGFVIAAYGLLPRVAGTLSMLVVLVSLLAGGFGDLLNLPEVLQEMSPFSHVAPFPADVTTASIAALLGIGLVLASIGLVAFRRRDLSL